MFLILCQVSGNRPAERTQPATLPDRAALVTVLDGRQLRWRRMVRELQSEEQLACSRRVRHRDKELRLEAALRSARACCRGAVWRWIELEAASSTWREHFGEVGEEGPECARVVANPLQDRYGDCSVDRVGAQRKPMPEIVVDGMRVGVIKNVLLSKLQIFVGMFNVGLESRYQSTQSSVSG